MMELRELSNKIDIDIDSSLERFSGYEALYIKYLKRFIQEQSYTQFKDAISTNNKEEIEKTAHTLKGVCGNLGLTTLFDLYNNIVKSVRTDDITEVQSLAAEAIKITDQTIEILQQLEQ